MFTVKGLGLAISMILDASYSLVICKREPVLGSVQSGTSLRVNPEDIICSILA